MNKYRGKPADVVSDKWVYGYYLKEWSRDACGGSAIRHYIYNFDKQKNYRVFPETVGQFTGARIDGKKLYQDDLCESEHSTAIFQVFWSEKLLQWQVRVVKSNCPEIMGMENPLWLSLVNGSIKKIFGNIHDNKELLEVAK